MRAAVTILTVLVFGCASESAQPVTDAGSVLVDARLATEAGRVLGDEIQEIYAARECPERLLPPDLEAHPTTVCSGRNEGQCWQELPCRHNADCTERAYGRCEGYERSGPDGGFIEYARCQYHHCRSDADCEPGKTCACGLDGLRLCVAAGCRVDDDCPEGGHCVRGDVCGAGPYGDFICTSNADTCQSNEDCRPTGNSCVVGERGHLVCIDIICD